MIVQYYEPAAGARRKQWRISPVFWEGIKYGAAGALFAASVTLLLALQD
jgi:hypothetical protein